MRSLCHIYPGAIAWKLRAAALCLCLSGFSADEAASQDICTSPAIEFAPLEPQEFTWWTGRKQKSQLIENGKVVAEVELRYRDRLLSNHNMYGKVTTIQVQDQSFTYRNFYGSDGIKWSSRKASGFIVPKRVDGTSSAQLYMGGKAYQQASIHFSYSSTREINRVFADLYCFLKSPIVAAGLK
jgi:hypothetical protein